jgi:hypothetical protein
MFDQRVFKKLRRRRRAGGFPTAWGDIPAALRCGALAFGSSETPAGLPNFFCLLRSFAMTGETLKGSLTGFKHRFLLSFTLIVSKQRNAYGTKINKNNELRGFKM